MTSPHGALAFDRELPHDADVSRWRPRTLCELADLAVLNACAVRRTPFKGSVEGLPVEVGLSPAYATTPYETADDCFEAILGLGRASARATLAYATMRLSPGPDSAGPFR